MRVLAGGAPLYIRNPQILDAWRARFAVIGSVVDKLARAGDASGYDRRRLAREQQAAEAKTAEARAGLDVTANTIQFVGSKPDGAAVSAPASSAPTGTDAGTMHDEDIPF